MIHKILYQPYHKFQYSIKKIYTEKPVIWSTFNNPPNRPRVVNDLDYIHNLDGRDRISIFKDFKEKRRVFEEKKKLVTNLPFFKFLQQQLNHIYGEEFVDFEIGIGYNYAFCIHFPEVVVSNETTSHTCYDCYVILQIVYQRHNNEYRERITHIKLFRSTFSNLDEFQDSNYKRDYVYFTHPHVTLSTYIGVISDEEDVDTSNLAIYCTGDGDTISSDIKTRYFSESETLRFEAFLYHIKDFISYEYSGNPYFSINKLQKKEESININTLRDMIYLILNYIDNCYWHYANSESRIVKCKEINNKFVDFFGIEFIPNSRIDDLIRVFLNKVETRLIGDELSITFDRLYDFIIEVKELTDKIKLEVVETFPTDRPVRSIDWSRVFVMYNSTNGKTRSLQDYNVFASSVNSITPIQESEVEDKSKLILHFKDKPVYLKIKSINAIVDLPQDYQLIINKRFKEEFENEYTRFCNKNISGAKSLAVYEKREEVRTYSRIDFLGSSSGLVSN